MGLKYFENKGDGEYEILMHGIVGSQIDGVKIANEIAYLNASGAKKIIERINTIGGSVTSGFSIVSANLASRARIHTINEGVCDSIGAALLASGDVRDTMEFGTGLVHNVIADGVTLEAIKDENERSNAKKVNESIINILTRKTGNSEDDLRAMMSKETRFSADELIANGFADNKIMIQGKKPELLENTTAEQYMNICKEFSANIGHNNKPKINSMSINKYLNLKPDATALDQEAAIKKLQNKAAKSDVLEARIETLEAEKKEILMNEAGKDVDNLIEQGYFKAEKKDELVNLAVDHPETFKSVVGSMSKPEKYVNISNTLTSGKKEKDGGKGDDEKVLAEKYENMMKEDPKGLEDLERVDNETFVKMYNAYNNH